MTGHSGLRLASDVDDVELEVAIIISLLVAPEECALLASTIQAVVFEEVAQTVLSEKRSFTRKIPSYKTRRKSSSSNPLLKRTV